MSNILSSFTPSGGGGGDLEWPTPEMASRGSYLGLVAGIAIAVPSGVSVALSILSNNIGSLVGVAISASLLPPAVNSGILFAYAMVGPTIHGDAVSPELFAQLGGISFLLALINIFIIYVLAIGMFKLKEVAPIPGKSDFWKQDLQNTRAYIDTVQGNAANDLAKAIRGLSSEHRQILEERVNNNLTVAGLNNPQFSDLRGQQLPKFGTVQYGNVSTPYAPHGPVHGTFHGGLMESLQTGNLVQDGHVGQLVDRLFLSVPDTQGKNPNNSQQFLTPENARARNTSPVLHLQEMFLRRASPFKSDSGKKGIIPGAGPISSETQLSPQDIELESIQPKPSEDKLSAGNPDIQIDLPHDEIG